MALSKIVPLSIATDAVETAKILDDNVTTAKILDNNVTLAKLGDGTQGDILYYGASGAPTRLGFGTSGDFLKTQGTGANPVWATVSAGMGTLLSTATASTSSTIDITANIDSSYTLYQIVVSDVDMSTNNLFQVQLYLGGVLETSSNYAFAGMDFQDGSSTTGLYGTSTQFQMTANFILATAAYNLFGSVFLYNPSSTASYKHISAITEFWMHDGACVHNTMGGGLETGNGTAVTGIRFKPSSGTIDSGTFRLYGYNAT
jgi:hypothetical protein|tara:strand:- start:311 stop:1087 length:777 start_codon:yes stop_codon:yes gene_type:complete